ncbi:espin-like isoform X3 [Bolinopsis microptera]|uniref:espin-like isoform X3 n=1 Tax=Bolinopsis microptera TaxID=2820187 RepID=UPI00307AC9AB
MLFLQRKRKRYSILNDPEKKEDFSIGHVNHAFVGSLDDLGLAPIHQLAREGDKKRVKKLTKAHRGFNFLRLKSKCGSVAAHYAAEHGHVDLLSWIYKYDRHSLDQEDEKGMTPLLMAVQHGQYDCLKYIIRHTAADILATNYKSQNGAHVASQFNHLHCLRLVASGGCPVGAHDYVGNTPLHIATQYNSTAVVGWLLKQTKLCGREVDDMGATSLHLACELGHVTLVRAFVRSGVPLTSEDNECRTPEIVAQMYNQTEVLRVLEEERKRLQLIEDFSPYVGSLTVRRDKRRRPDIRKETGLFSPRRAENSSLLSPKRDPNLSSSANSLESHPLKRSNTICTSGDVQAYLRSKCNREFAASRDGSDSMSFKRHSKSTFDSGFESGLSDILDEILGGGQYDPVLEESMPKTKWQSFKGKLTEAFHKSKRNELNDAMSDNSDIKSTKWDKVSQFVKVKIAKVSNQDLDMGGFEDNQWRSLEPRQFHRGTRRTQSFVKWNRARER